jgi:hypothetical protein
MVTTPRRLTRKGDNMRNFREKGAVGYIALWALGVPASALLVIFLLRGCT